MEEKATKVMHVLKKLTYTTVHRKEVSSRAWTVLITYPYLYQDIRDTLHIKRMTPLSFHFCVSELSPSITYQRHSLLLEVIWLSPFTDCINCGPMFRK